MTFKNLLKSTKLFVILLILAIALLIFIGSISFKQISDLRKSAALVNRTMEVDKEINRLFSLYTTMESVELENLLRQDTLGTASSYQNFAEEAYDSFERLASLTNDNQLQQNYLADVFKLQENLRNSLSSVSQIEPKKIELSQNERLKVNNLSILLSQLDAIKSKMLEEEQRLLKERKAKYKEEVLFTPLMILFWGMFALLVFIISFLQINKQRKKTKTAEAFLQNILVSTGYVIMYFEPTRDKTKNIIDFELLYINSKIEDITGDAPNTIIGTRASKTFPTIFKTGVFEKMVNCIETGKTTQYETKYETDGKTSSFSATAAKLNDGVTITTRDNTAEKETERNLKELNEQLAIQNSIFVDAESVADIGSYVWYLDTGTANISDNFYRILGHEPQSFEVSFDSYREFVHTDDLEIYDQMGSETFKTGKSVIDVYRIKTKHGKTKHLQLNGHVTEKDGRKVSVGVVQDISKRIRAEQKLKNQNEALKRSNTELESFNRVASHDLQEPMRKIQMFISRIADKELDKLSGKGRTYFVKINSSANRMQTLIKYLLSYSRINKDKQTFFPVSLNEVVDKVLDDLDERITEYGVEITVDELPTIKAIPFQMEQLFNNLLSNAIKYGNASETPKISVHCKKLSKKDITDDFDKKRKSYFQLSFIDNGIGFDQANAKKIFGLFERLHQRHQYSGTGIGLAICKKIVDNHKGHIVAESQLGKGATFRVYLPA
jgi:PAS domain S-box-containing protein